MQLPKIEYPVYEVKLSSIDAPVRFRPFVVKEQKLMMMALESDSIDDVVKTLKQVITNCALDPVDVDTLPYVDIEMFYLHLRARSVSEKIDVFFKCNNLVEEKPCNMVINFDVDLLSEVEVVNNTESNRIMFTDTVGVVMRYPTIEQIKILNSEENVTNRMIIDCLDKIIGEDEIYSAKEASYEELEEWVEKLPAADYDKLDKFLLNAPVIQYKKNHTCPKCGHIHEMKLEGLNDFFT